MLSEALGRIINVHYPADDVYISMRDCAGITFVGHEVDGATVFLLTYAADAAGTGAVTPDNIDHYYAKSADVSSGVWHRTAVSPASETFTAADGTEDLVVVEVLASSCPDGKPWVKLAADGAGTVVAIQHDLAYQRAPQNLRSITA